MARTFGGLTVEELREIVARHKGLGWTHAAVNALPDLLAEIERLRVALDKYGVHTLNVCDLAAMDAYEPERGFKIRGKWQTEKPTCTCGLDLAIGGNDAE